MGGTVEQTELINGIAIDYPVIKSYGGPNKMINARVALIQFSISSPSTDTENSLVIENYTHMDKLLKEEKELKKCIQVYARLYKNYHLKTAQDCGKVNEIVLS